MPEVGILGSGAVGALLGAALARAGVDVALITRDASAAAIARDGVHVESPRFGDHRVRVRALTALEEPAAALVVAVKAPHLAAALDRVAVAPGVVVPLLNGVEHVGALRARFAGRVVPGVVRVQAHRAAPAHVVHRAPFLEVTLAQPGHGGLVAVLRVAGVDADVGGTEAAVLWGKLARLAGLALATTAADAPLRAVRADAEAVAAEVVAVANAEGAGLDAGAIVAELRGLPDAASSSLRADVAAGRPDHELDAIGGAVLRAAARHGIAVPCTADLVARTAGRTRGSL